ncbi:MAG: FKBP-type peptidyl-prolyl cis-trans isomerase [Actinomycetia bacterium]|nr:FKBP-type peptidyl-prolyl cis-trans isomerase [Actinomycetes bacterium]MCP4961156.1 FKBP-type peptidyl-prolyl cis-trans isomerase [Actinomycetes bacterium]
MTVSRVVPKTPLACRVVDVYERPEISVPDTEPPAELALDDLVEGDGAEAQAGMTVTVDYVGASWSTGSEFDASWNRGETFSFGLGAGQVISGWDQGVAGMCVGGRRRITIPPQLGYGARGAGGVIGPNETLIFVVDLRSVG